MPLTQDDIRRHYESAWAVADDDRDLEIKLDYGDPVANLVQLPVYESMARDLRLAIDGGCVLDVGSGAGRWVRFFLERFSPERVVAVDYTKSSVDLVQRWSRDHPEAPVEARVVDFTDHALPVAELGGPFDVVNVANVLFHIPENDKFAAALANIARVVADDGRIVTTEYMPRATMRTEWMRVRSRYEFEAACDAAGLRIVHIRPCAFFSNDPMGLDGPDSFSRQHFHNVRAGIRQLMDLSQQPDSRSAMARFLAEIERATLAFCAECCSPVDLPSQKFVVLARS